MPLATSHLDAPNHIGQSTDSFFLFTASCVINAHTKSRIATLFGSGPMVSRVLAITDKSYFCCCVILFFFFLYYNEVILSNVFILTSIMITPKETLLLLIDVQGRLAEAVFQHEEVAKNISKLIRACTILDVPVLVTEQYPKGLGHTIDALKELLPGNLPVEKKSFSCCGAPEFMKQLRLCRRNDILVVGMETHVCVYQTSVELLEFGYNVHLVTDGVSSRTAENKHIGIRCIEKAGASLTSTEMAVFELLRVAEGEKFKAISNIVKE